MIIEWVYSMKLQAQTMEFNVFSMEPHGSSMEFHEGTLHGMF